MKIRKLLVPIKSEMLSLRRPQTQYDLILVSKDLQWRLEMVEADRRLERCLVYNLLEADLRLVQKLVEEEQHHCLSAAVVQEGQILAGEPRNSKETLVEHWTSGRQHEYTYIVEDIHEYTYIVQDVNMNTLI